MTDVSGLFDRKQWTENDLLIRDEAYKIGWNEAIEAAAKLAEHEGYFNGGKTIRKLKK